VEPARLVVRTVKPFFGGLPVRSIGQPQVEVWKIKRGAAVGLRSFNYEREVLRRLFEYVRTSLFAKVFAEPWPDWLGRMAVRFARIVCPEFNSPRRRSVVGSAVSLRSLALA